MFELASGSRGFNSLHRRAFGQTLTLGLMVYRYASVTHGQLGHM
jgi:hypothetical protein